MTEEEKNIEQHENSDANQENVTWWQKFKEEWTNAFSMKVDEDQFNEADRNLIDAIAEDIAERRLASAAIMFLVSIKPVSFLMSQGMQFTKPFMPGQSEDATGQSFAQKFSVGKLISNPEAYSRFALLMENRQGVDLLVECLEKHEDGRAQRERKEKLEKKTDNLE